MAYDPYKSLLANVTREHLKRSNDLNTHLVGNVFLPAIDVHHQKKSNSKSAASLKHLKVVEQCILAENKREERLAKCATIKDRRTLAKKFQLQRERERELIHALMLGQYPESHQEINLFETDVVAATTPRQQVHQETTGITAKAPPPDRIFHKENVTGGVSKAKPHAHEKFKLPQCNGLPGKKGGLRAQALAAANLSSPTRRSMGTRKSQEKGFESPSHKNLSPSWSARTDCSVRTPKADVKTSGGDITADTEKLSPKPNTNSPRTSPQRARPFCAVDMNSDPNQSENSFIAFEGALSYSEAQHRALDLKSEPLKQQLEISLIETATQTTPRLMGELPPVNSSPLRAALTQNGSSTTPRRPLSGGVVRSTRQAFLESLAKENEKAKVERKTRSDHEGNDAISNKGDDTSNESKQENSSGPTTANEAADDEKSPEATEGGNEGGKGINHALAKTLNEPLDTKQASGDDFAAANDVVVEGKAPEATEPLGQPNPDRNEGVDYKTDDTTAEPLDTKQVSGRDSAPVDSSDEDDKALEARESSRTTKPLDQSDQNLPVEEDLVVDNAGEGVPDSAVGTEDDIVTDDNFSLDEELETDVAEVLFDLIDLVAAAIEDEEKAKPGIILTARTISPRSRLTMDEKSKFALRIQSFFRGYRARIAFRLALYEDALSCGVLGAMPGTIQGRSGWYLDPKRLMAYYFAIPDPDGDWDQKHVLRCSRLVLTPYEMRQEVLSKVCAFVAQMDGQHENMKDEMATF